MKKTQQTKEDQLSARDRQARIEEELATLRRAVEELQGELAAARQAAQAEPGDQRQHSRRDLLRLGGAALLGAAGAAGASALSVTPALAANGGNMVLGQTNTADATTVLEQQTTGTTPMFEVLGPGITTLPTGTQQGFNGAVVGVGPSTKDGVDGFASGTTGAGVVGQSDSGYGVIGAASTGVDLAGLGSGRLFLRDLASAGPPGFTATSGGSEVVVDQNGVVWVGDAVNGWRRINTLLPLTPVRVVDSRASQGSIGGQTGPFAAGSYEAWQIAGSHGVPSTAIAIVGNVTAVSGSGSFPSGGFLTMFPTGASSLPNVASLNYLAGMAYLSNFFFVGLGSGANSGKVTVYVGGNPADIVIDLFAYVV